MDKADRVAHYAAAKRATAGKITQIEDGKFVSSWVGKLRGMIVSAADGTYKHATKDDALECARGFRDRCRAEIEKRGLPHNARHKPRAEGTSA